MYFLKNKQKNFIRASQITQIARNLPPIQETPVQFMGQEVSLEKR